MRHILHSDNNKNLVLTCLLNDDIDIQNWINEHPMYNLKHFKIASEADLEQIDKTFLGCYKYDNGNISVDFDLAKNVWLEKYRKARTPILEQLDVEFMRALESGDISKQQEIANKKQSLRDITTTELPDNLSQIKNTWPEVLGKNPFI